MLCVLCSMIPSTLTEKLYGVRVKVFGYQGKLDDRCLMIMNHRCHLDWFFLWGLVAKMGDLSIWKTVMKRGLRSIPIIGMSPFSVDCACLIAYYPLPTACFGLDWIAYLLKECL